MSRYGFCWDERDHRERARQDARYDHKDRNYYDRHTWDPCKEAYTEAYDHEQRRLEQERYEQRMEEERRQERQRQYNFERQRQEAWEEGARRQEELEQDQQEPEPEYAPKEDGSGS